MYVINESSFYFHYCTTLNMLFLSMYITYFIPWQSGPKAREVGHFPAFGHEAPNICSIDEPLGNKYSILYF